MNTTIFRTVRSRALRISLGLLTAATVLSSAFGLTAPAQAQGPIIRDHRDPFARVQLVVNRIIIHDDMDWGKGEFRFEIGIRANSGRCELFSRTACGQPLVLANLPQYSGSDGANLVVDRIVPADGDSGMGEDVGPAIGVPVRPGQWLGFSIRGTENDPASDDFMGVVASHITGEDGQVQYGVRTERAVGKCEERPILADFCIPGTAGAFSVEYEVRPAPLPDLHPTAFRVGEIGPGDRDDLVCFTVENRGLAASDPFRVKIVVDDLEPRTTDIGAFGLAVGETREQCTSLRLPESGNPKMTFDVDLNRVIAEMDERNNHHEQTLALGTPVEPVPGPATSKADAGQNTGVVPQPKPGAAQAANQASGQPDLTVSAIRVNGQAPDGKDDCKDGKNPVAVLVKNAGAANAGSFAVRLTVDGGEAIEEAVDGLEAGKEREIRFGDVRLKKGEHQLAAAADPKNTVAESDEADNDLAVTARCKDGS